jgi:hypothetical protein
MTKDQRMLMKALSAIAHYQEYIDTNQPADLYAAIGVMQDTDLQKWVTDNAVMLPLRRDGKSLRKAILETKPT